MKKEQVINNSTVREDTVHALDVKIVLYKNSMWSSTCAGGINYKKIIIFFWINKLFSSGDTEPSQTKNDYHGHRKGDLDL